MVRQATAGLGTIAASVFDLDDIDALKVERDENDQRKKPTISERVALAKAIAERLKPIDPAEIEAARKRYEEVKQAVDCASAELAAERAQRKNRFIDGDKRRFAKKASEAESTYTVREPGKVGQPDIDNLLDESDPYGNIDTRPGTREAQRDAGRDAMRALRRRLFGMRGEGRDRAEGGAVSVLGATLHAGFQAGEANALTGQRIEAPADLAALAQVYRDPRFETFRAIYVKDGKVVGEAGYSSRLPAVVKVPQDMSEQIRTDLDRFGADGYYMLHNHPSGSATPSVADLQLTNSIARDVAGFLGHVVIDHNEYAVIREGGKVQKFSAPELAATDYRENPAVKHMLLRAAVTNPRQVVQLGKALQIKGGHATLVLMSGELTNLIVDVPTSMLQTVDKASITRMKAVMRRMARESGSGQHRFMILPEGANIASFAALVTDGVVTDVVSADGRSLREQGTPYYGDFLNENIPVKRVAEEGSPYSADAKNEGSFRDTERAYGGREAYERAKAAGQTKLNYRQWVQVRTPAFKAWFGDWDALQRQSSMRRLIDRALGDNTWQQRTVIAEGVDADPSGKLSEAFGFEVRKQYLTPDDIRKSDKRHGEGKERDRDQVGLTHDDYVKALEVLRDPETFKRTISNNGKPSAEFGRRFEDGTLVVAEVETAEDGAVSIKSAWKKVPGRNHAGATPYPIRTSDNTAGVDSILHSDSLLVNPDSVSKVTDPDTGEPMVVYHGTDADFTSFSHERLGVTTGAPSAKRGFFFASTPEMANRYPQYDTSLILHSYGLLRRDGETKAEYEARVERDGVGPIAERAQARARAAEKALRAMGIKNPADKPHAVAVNSGSLTRQDAVAIEDDALGKFGVKSEDDLPDDTYNGAYSDMLSDMKKARVAELVAEATSRKDALGEAAREVVEAHEEAERAQRELEYFTYVYRWSRKADAGGNEDDQWEASKTDRRPNVMPVFLKASTPLVHDFKQDGYRDTSYNDLLMTAENERRDGAMFMNTADPTPGDVFIVFDPTQIKSESPRVSWRLVGLS